jgi:uncharacterized protein (TIGR02646 family)
MIRRDRSQVARPAALDQKYGRRVKPPKLKDKTELESVREAFKKHVDSGEHPVKFKFPFERYKDEDVHKALKQLFQGKCSYCESNYAGTQPMDVEHWRPKGEVHLDDGSVLPGYYWLASEWTNLLPSCIDCNRARTQFDEARQQEVTLGKANQFPVKDARMDSPDDDPSIEEPLILNPCDDDPEKFLRYTEEGVVVPRAAAGWKRERALASIRVYALNRSELVAERLAVRKLIDHRIDLIAQLRDIRDQLNRPGDETLHDVVQDLIASEMDALLAMSEADQPYAGMVREILDEADPS